MLNTSKIEKIRKFKGFTQIAFAEKIGLKISAYQNLINSGNFRVEHLLKISEELGISIPNLFSYETNEAYTEAAVEEERAEYQTKISELKKEIKYLKEINDLLKNKNE